MKPITRQVRLRVRELAAERGLSDYDIAGQARVDIRVVRKMLNNEQVREMKINQLARVAEVLDVPTSTLFVDE